MNIESILIVPFMLLAYIGGVVTGYNYGRKEEYIKAKQAGVGHWESDSKGNSRFEYKN